MVIRLLAYLVLFHRRGHHVKTWKVERKRNLNMSLFTLHWIFHNLLFRIKNAFDAKYCLHNLVRYQLLIVFIACKLRPYYANLNNFSMTSVYFSLLFFWEKHESTLNIVKPLIVWMWSLLKGFGIKMFAFHLLELFILL